MPRLRMYAVIVSAFQRLRPGSGKGAGNAPDLVQFSIVATHTPMIAATSLLLSVAAVWIALICFFRSSFIRR